MAKHDWRDFPEFYDNPFINSIRENPKWTVSDKDKRPIDMWVLVNEQRICGASWKYGHEPLVTLDELLTVLPNCANNAYLLNAIDDRFVVLDIEPKCPDTIKQEMLKLPYLYGEVSMSGNGYHLVFPLPEKLWIAYPNIQTKQVLKETNGYFEILLSHYVTFTRNVIQPDPTITKKSEDEWLNMFKNLARTAKPSTQVTVSKIEVDLSGVPEFGKIMAILSAQKFLKTPADYHDDMSVYEWAFTGFYWNKLKLLFKTMQVSYTEEQKAMILYEIVRYHIPPRDKHATTRCGMPWLLYLATTLIAKSK